MLHEPKRSICIRVLLSILAVLASIELLYVIAIGLFLNTSLFKKFVDLDPNETAVTVHFGWSLLPGSIHIYGSELRSQDPNVRWFVKLPSSVLKVDLNDLRSKTLHIAKVSSEGISFKLELKTPAEKKEFLASAPPKIPLEEKKKTHWKLLFDQVDLTKIKSLEAAGVIYEGDAEIHGKLDLWPGIRAEIGPAELVIHSGNLTSAAEPNLPLLKNVQAKTWVHFQPFSIDSVSGSEAFHYLDGTASIQGKLDLTHHNKKGELKAEGDLNLDFEAKQGIAQPTSKLSLSSLRIRSTRANWETVAEGDLQGKVSASGDQHFGKIDLNLDRFYFEDREIKEKLISGESFQSSIGSTDLDLRTFFENRRLDVSLSKTRILGGVHWEKYIQHKPQFTLISNSGTLSAHLEAKGGSPENIPGFQHGKKSFVKLRLLPLHGIYKSADFGGALAMTADFGTLDLRNQKGLLKSVRWEVADADWKIKKEDTPQWWLKWTLNNVQLNWSNSIEASGQSSLSFKNMEPFLRIYRIDHDLSNLKYSIFNRGPVKFSTKFSASSSEDDRQISLRPFKVDASPLHAHGEAQWTDEESSGRISGHYGLVSIGLKFKNGKTGFRLFPSDKWLKINGTK